MATRSPFSWADILYVSEIGLVVDDVAAAADAIKDMAAVAPYKGGDGDFTAMGDEYGLLLVMKRGRIIDFTGNADNGVRVYRTGVNLRGAKAATHQLASHPYRLTIEERCSCASSEPWPSRRRTCSITSGSALTAPRRTSQPGSRPPGLTAT